MKQIKILLSSVLTLLLITSNNAYAAPHYSDYSGKPGFKAKQPNMNSGGRFMPKRNRLGDDISGYGYKNILKKGNVFRGNVRMLPNRNSGGVFSSNPFQAISEDQAIMTRPYRLGEDVGSGTPLKGGSSSWRDSGKVEVENSRQNWGYRVNERKFIGEDGKEVFPKVELGPDVVTTLEHGPGVVNDNDSRITFPDDLGPPGIVYDNDSRIGSTGGVNGVQQPKSVPLKFINGEWVEEQSLKPYAWP